MAHLTIDPDLLGVDREGVFRLYSRGLGGAGSVFVKGFGYFQELHIPSTGPVTTNIPLSEDICPPQEYHLYHNGQHLGAFRMTRELMQMPLAFSALKRTTSPLVVPALISATAPVSPGEGEWWFDVGSPSVNPPSPPRNILKVRHNGAWIAAVPTHISDTAPASPGEGEWWFNPTTKILSVWHNGQWIADIGMSSDAATKRVADGAVQVDSFDLSGRDLTVASAGGSSQTLTIPGITIDANGVIQGNPNEVTRVNFTGAGVSTAVTGTVATVTILADSSAIDSSITAIRDRLDDLEDTEQDIRKDTVLANAVSVTVTPNSWTPIPGPIAVPSARHSNYIEATVTASGIDPAHTQFKVQALIDAGSSGISFTNIGGPGDDNNRYRLRKSGSDFEFQSDTQDTYLVTLKDSEPDVTGLVKLAPTGTNNVDLTRVDGVLHAQYTGPNNGGGGHGTITSVVAGEGLTGGATTGGATLNVNPGQGIDISGDKVQVKLDATSDTANPLSRTDEGLDILPGGIQTEHVADGAITEGKLADDVAAKLHTDSEIEGIVKRIEAVSAVDTVTAFTGVNIDSFTTLDFNTGSVSWRFSSFDYDAGEDTVTIAFIHPGPSLTPITQADLSALRPYHLAIGSYRFAFADAVSAIPPPGTTINFTWSGVTAQPWVSGSATNTITVFEPLGPENYVPENNDDGKVLESQSGFPVWAYPAIRSSVGIERIEFLTMASYRALAVKDSKTLYITQGT